MRRAAAGLGIALALLAAPGPAAAATAPASTPTAPVFDSEGRIVSAPFAPVVAPPRLTEREATAIAEATPKVAGWLRRYPPKPTTAADFDRTTRQWTVNVWSGKAGEIATATVEDATGRVLTAWTGPQVAWRMARGGRTAFGGKTINEPLVWYGLCALFLVALADVRRPLSLRNADLVALLAFSASLEAFDRGEVFRSVPLAYPPLVWLLGRAAWIGFRGRRERTPAVRWPVWVLAAAAIFLTGFRIGLDVQPGRTVIDVGFAGVVGADRILHGQAPYGHMPVEGDRPACGPADASGEIRERIQTNGRCEAANPFGDTYGPVSYLAYVPAVAAFGWSGHWDSLPAGRASSIAFDVLAAAGLALVGLRFGGRRLALTLAVAWEAYPFTAYALLSNTNDALMPALLVWGFWLLTSPWARGAAVALAGWTKFAALAVAPLWLAYPRLDARTAWRALAGFAVATIASFSILLLEPGLGGAIRTFWHRTVRFQVARDSPFSLWDWGQYHARGIPALRPLQRVLEAGVVAFAALTALVPRRKGPLELAALTAALLLAVQLVLTHWFYLYLPWALPFVALALFLPRGDGARA